MIQWLPPESQILSHHAFTQPRIRIWLPVVMVLSVTACVAIIPPHIRALEVLGLALLVYVAISAMVSVCEIAVAERGLIVSRLLLPRKFIPWNAIDRVLVLSGDEGAHGTQLEIASIGIREGLSPLNRLPGLVYGQGFRQTIIVLRDAVEDYETLLESLRRHCRVVHAQARR